MEKTSKTMDVLNEWRVEFKERVKLLSKSRKQDFTYIDALNKKEYHTERDLCFIEASRFLSSNPLRNNDYVKFVSCYIETGEKLNPKYFRNNIDKLNDYYAKVDEPQNKVNEIEKELAQCKKGTKDYEKAEAKLKEAEAKAKIKLNPFNRLAYRNYVLFMVLKLRGQYLESDDQLFNVEVKDNREYNPLSKVPSVLRGELPFLVKEYDIKRAFPTFINIELKINPDFDVYSLVNKRTFNMLLNIHSGTKNAKIESVRKQLTPVYFGRVNEVITEERFNNQGQMFRDLVKYEAEAIEDFVKANELVNYVRLHDGIFVLKDVECNHLKFDKIEFAVKECITPPIENETVNFYTIDDADNVETSPKMYADFFDQENFIRVSQYKNDTITIFKDSNNVIKPFNHRTDIVPFLKENINEIFPDAVENKIAHDCYNDIQKSYLLLNPVPLVYHRDTRKTFGIPFKNDFFEFTQGEENLKIMQYKDVNGFFAPHPTQEREFTFQKVPEVSVFERFLKFVSVGKENDLTENETEVFLAFCSMFGYLIHQYKDESNSPSIILSDANANDKTRNGGRGKTIFTKAVSQVRKSMLKGGAEFEPSYLFNYSDLTVDCNVFIIDDVPAGFNYNALYTQISGGINCQRKGKPAEEIPFKESPKFVITTNWSYRVEDNSTSTQRRFIEYQFTDFFNLTNTPVKVFNQILFEDWDESEWNRFYNFAFFCVGYYLEFGLNRIAYNKTEDNFRASFNNDVVLEEMERIINVLIETRTEFGVSDFLKIYKDISNNLRFENFFHYNNTKNLIEIFVKHHNINVEYCQRRRKWIVKTTTWV
jgi:hypothetical protein